MSNPTGPTPDNDPVAPPGAPTPSPPKGQPPRDSPPGDGPERMMPDHIDDRQPPESASVLEARRQTSLDGLDDVGAEVDAEVQADRAKAKPTP